MALNGEHAIVVEGVSKCFRRYTDRPTSLKQAVTRFRRSRYEEFWALRDVSLEVPAGQSFGLIGHNGSGKSTLLRLMARIHRPTSGRVVTRGRVSALLELGAGFHPELSGRENIYLNGAILGLDKRDLDRVFDEIVEFSGLGPFIDSPVKIYSSGMYVRLGFAVSVHVRPDILMIDEVIAVGDQEFQNRCFDHLYRMKRDGRTIVVVSHSLGLMQTLCDRIAWLDHGRLMEVGQPIDVIRAYKERVAEQEADRLERVAGDAPVGRAESAEVELVAFEVLDSDERLLAMPRTGDPLTFRIHYQANAPVQDPVFRLEITTENGMLVSAYSTSMARRPTGVIEGAGYIDCRLERLELLAATYLVSVSITDRYELHVFDALPDPYELHVRPGSEIGDGIVPLRGTWSSSTPTERRQLPA